MRTTHTRSPLTLAMLFIACAGSPHAKAAPLNAWLGASDGDWFDSSRWSLGASPPTSVDAEFPSLLIDAAGAPYTISAPPAPLLGYVESVLVDSPDVTLDLASRLVVLGLFDLRRGVVRLDGSVEASDIQIGTSAVLIGENGARSTLDGRVVNHGRIDLTGNHRLNVNASQSNALPTLVNEGTISLTSGDAGAPRIVVDQLLNHGVIELVRTPGVANAAALTTDFILNTGEIVADHSFVSQSDIANAGVIRLHSGGSVTFLESATTFLGNGRVTGGDVYVGAFGANRETVVEGPLRSDARVILHDRARVSGGITTSGAIVVEGQHINVTGGLFSGDDITVVGDSVRLEGPLSSGGAIHLSNLSLQSLGSVVAQSLRIDASTLEFNAPVLVTETTTISGGEITFRAPVSRTGDLELIGSDLTVGADAPGGAATLHVDGDLVARSSATLRNFRSDVTVQGNLEWNAAAGSRIEMPLDVTGSTLIRNAHIQTSITTTRATLGGTISGNPTLIVTEGPVIVQSGIVRPGVDGVRGRFAVEGDLLLGAGLTSRIEIDVLVGANGFLTSDVFEIANGDATLNAVLDVRLHSLAAPLLQVGDTFTILTADALSGEFLQVLLPSLPDGLFFDVVYDPSAVRLIVAPAPGAGASGLLVLAGLMTRRRSRNTRA